MFRYFGAKHALAATYQPPRYGTIIEPFAGAAGYTCYWLEQRSDLQAVLVEKDAAVADLWRELLSMTPDEIAAMPDVKHGDRPQALLPRLTLGAIRPAVSEWGERDWPDVRRQVARRRANIDAKVVTVIEGDYRLAPDIEATWFIDPPYQHQGHEYRQGSAGLDYEDLADWCKSRRGQVIVTEARPADWLPFRPHKSFKSIANTINVELVWTNQPDDQLSMW